VSGAGAGAAAAAAKKRREQEEEEEMSSYSPQDLADGWEFKFVRSTTGAFRRTAFLNEVLEEERRNGWTLVEKFDNSRIRLKRPVSARKKDAEATLDPYRSRVGIGELAFALLIICSILGGMGAIFGTIGLIARTLR